MPDNSILSRLDGLKIKYEEIGQQMTDPEVIADVRKFIALNKEYKELEPIVHTSEKYRTALNNLAGAKEILATEKDEELREMARMEVSELEPAVAQMEEQIKLLLIPADPQDSKNATCCACIPNSLKREDGSMRSTAPAKAARAASRRS